MTRAGRRHKRMSSSPPVRAAEHLMTGGDRRQMRHAAAVTFWRATSVVIVLSLLYAFSPLGEKLHVSVLLELVGALTALVAVTIWEFWNVARSSYPEFRALEAAAVTLTLLLLSFASIYVVMSSESAGSFNQHLSRLDALYFTVTTFSTVGYGDIVARTEAARAVVTSQILVNLLLIALIGRALFGTAQRRRQRLRSTPEPEPGTSSPEEE